MKNLILILLILINASVLHAQSYTVDDSWQHDTGKVTTTVLSDNVGVGTRYPRQLLDVNGTVVVSDNLGIGTFSPTANLDVFDGIAKLPPLTTVNSQYVCLEDGTNCPPAVFFDPADYGTATFGSGTSYIWTMNAGATDPTFSFSSGTVDLNNASFTIHGTDSQIKFANNKYVNGDTARNLKIGSTDGTNNEDLLLDNDTTANTIAVTSTTGVTKVDFGTIGLRNTSSLNSAGNLSVGTSGTPASPLSVAGGVSIGTGYAVAHGAPLQGMAVQGNVGIGTWLAPHTLEVVGTAKATAFIGDGSLLTNVPTGSQYWVTGNVGINTTSNVGIGSINPGKQLDVTGTVRATAFVGDGSLLTGVSSISGLTTNYIPKASSSTAIGNGSMIDTGNIGVGTAIPEGRLIVYGNGTSTLPTQTWKNSSGTQLMTIRDNGNIGIGTGTPGALLSLANGLATIDSTGIITSNASGGIIASGGINVPAGQEYQSAGNRVNYNLTVYASGTAYSMTASDAAIDFGTTDPSLTLDKAGTYLLIGRAFLKYNAATYAGSQTATVKLRRTNNTAADVTSATTTVTLRIITTITDSVGVISIPAVIYTTSNSDDVISAYGSLSATPSAGSVDVSEASIVAIRLY